MIKLNFRPFRRGEEKAHCILQTQLNGKCISYAVLWESTWPAVLYLDRHYKRATEFIYKVTLAR